jgi:methionine synthase I (cobalamin-dependent)
MPTKNCESGAKGEILLEGNKLYNAFSDVNVNAELKQRLRNDTQYSTTIQPFTYQSLGFITVYFVCILLCVCTTRPLAAVILAGKSIT